MEPGSGSEGGSLEQISFALLLIRALDKRWSGTLYIDPPALGMHRIQVDRGLVSRILVPDGYARLGEILIEAGVVMPAELETALEAGGVLGEALRRAQLIDGKTLQRALVLQLLKRLVRLFGAPTTARWRYRAGDEESFQNLPEGIRVDTLRVLWAGVSEHGEMGAWLSSTLRRIGESPFRVRRDVNLRRFGFSSDARTIVRFVRDQQCTFRELVERTGLDERLAQLVVYVLAITRHLDFAPAGTSSTLAGNVEHLTTTGTNRALRSTDGEPEVAAAPPPPPARKRQASRPERVEVASPTPPDEDGLPTGAPPSPANQEDQNLSNTGRQLARIQLRRVARRDAPPGEASSSRGAGADLSVGIDQVEQEEERAALEGRAAALRSRLARLGSESPFDLLQLDPDDLASMTEDEIMDRTWKALEAQSDEWNPERCPAHMTALRDGMEKLNAALSKAFEVIVDPNRRQLALAAARVRNPSRERAPAPPTPPEEPHEPTTGEFALPSDRPAESLPGPEPLSGERAASVDGPPSKLHERALVAILEHRYEDAHVLMERAVEAEPQDPDYTTTYCWARAHMPHADLELILFDFDDILRQHPAHATSGFLRAKLLRRMGRRETCAEALRKLLEHHPSHPGARRLLDELTHAGESQTG